MWTSAYFACVYTNDIVGKDRERIVAAPMSSSQAFRKPKLNIRTMHTIG